MVNNVYLLSGERPLSSINECTKTRLEFHEVAVRRTSKLAVEPAIRNQRPKGELSLELNGKLE